MTRSRKKDRFSRLMIKSTRQKSNTFAALEKKWKKVIVNEPQSHMRDRYYGFYDDTARPKKPYKIPADIFDSFDDTKLSHYIGFDSDLKSRSGVTYFEALHNLRTKPPQLTVDNGVTNRLSILDFLTELDPSFDAHEKQLKAAKEKLQKLRANHPGVENEQTQALEVKIESLEEQVDVTRMTKDATVCIENLPPPPPKVESQLVAALPPRYKPFLSSTLNDRSGSGLFALMDRRWSTITRADQYLTQASKIIQLEDLVRRSGSSAFNVSLGGARKKKKKKDLSSKYAKKLQDTAVRSQVNDLSASFEVQPLLPFNELMSSKTQRDKTKREKTPHFMAFSYSGYLSQMKLDALTLGTSLKSPDIQHIEEKYLSHYYETSIGKNRKKDEVDQEQIATYRFEKEIREIPKKVLHSLTEIPEEENLKYKFFKQHNTMMKRFQVLYESSSKYKPKYPAWQPSLYAKLLDTDILLKKALEFRHQLEDKIDILRQIAKLKSLGIQKLQPINEQIPERLPLYEQEMYKTQLKQSYRDRTLGQIVTMFRKRTPPRRSFDDALNPLIYEPYRWVFDFGEIEITEKNITSRNVANVAFSPPSDYEIISPKIAIQWAFGMAQMGGFAKFSFPNADNCNIDINFDTMKVFITCFRDGIKVYEELSLDPVFNLIPSRRNRGRKYNNDNNKKSLEEEDDDVEYARKPTEMNENTVDDSIRFHRDDDFHLELKLVTHDVYDRLMQEKNDFVTLLNSLRQKKSSADFMHLIGKVKKINTVDRSGLNALHLATMNNDLDVAMRIIQLYSDKVNEDWSSMEQNGFQKLDINSTNNDGNTALHLAILHKHYSIANLLLNHHVDIHAKNDANNTPFDLFVSIEDKESFFVKSSFSSTALDANSFSLWFYILQIADISEVVLGKRIFEYVSLRAELASGKDANGRVAVDMATPHNRQVINSVLLWHGRYRVIEARPDHQSATCFVYRALDENDKDETGNPRQVALKLIRLKAHFEREIMARKHNFHQDYVVDIVARYPVTDEEVVHWPDDVTDEVKKVSIGGQDGTTGVSTKAQAEQFFCLVMPYATRNMFVALKQERFAGRNMEEVRHIFTQLVQCVSHLHERGVLHADLKTLNIVRMDTQWKLIDMDASCIIQEETVGYKTSSAYLPPEAIYVDPLTMTAKVRSCAPEKVSQSIAERGYELLLASPSFDIWSLGCILYQMCNTDVRPLFQGGQDDNLSLDIGEDDNLFMLAEWSGALKARKLQRVADPMARNLLSQILQKDVQLRPSLSNILLHPFLSKRHVARVLGEKPDYDMFISYRVASDSHHAELLYNLLSAQGLRVWWDKKCLQPGVEWKEGFCAGLVNSRMIVCLISTEAIAHPANPYQSFVHLQEHSHCDNVLLEYRLAMELHGFHYLDQVIPVYIGRKKLIEEKYEFYQPFWSEFSMEQTPMPDVHVHAIEEDLCMHMLAQSVSTQPKYPQKTVKDVFETLVHGYPGLLVQGEKDPAWNYIIQQLKVIVQQLDEDEERQRRIAYTQQSNIFFAVQQLTGGTGNASSTTTSATVTTAANTMNEESMKTIKKQLLVNEIQSYESMLYQVQREIDTLSNLGMDTSCSTSRPTSATASSGRKALHQALFQAKEYELSTLLKEVHQMENELTQVLEENMRLKHHAQ